ncbi:MBL fold metallo-hydrolase [Rhizobium tumorigenes]|uniref:MBL fold metallo-hydrolase n=1 Tax=Rhizobium tumorigenes TaxID=2041385 RepID=A0AAF1KAG4_9HYPH|nr:MBL fold metallo-hydrolase [Rhizobium tumorigenes]WFR95882.1 MBL fold metallo-hydrolase [Rhizobium tumorigenes]
MTVLSLPEINQFKLGALKFTVIKDGVSILDRPWETFGVNQRPETVQALLADNFLPTDRFVNSYSPVIIDSGTDVILVDTGFGAAMREKGGGRLAAGMKAAGYAPESITRVLLTHLHGDHIAGLMEDGKPAFANASYTAGRIEYDFWTDEARQGTPAEGNQKSVLANVVPLAEKITFVNDGDTVVPGMTAMLAPGHTPGHMVFHVESEGEQIVLTADTANHYVLSLQQPDWEVRFDLDKVQAAQTRRRIFDLIAKDRIPFLGYHMPFPAVGFVEKIDTGFRFVPKSYQFDF